MSDFDSHEMFSFFLSTSNKCNRVLFDSSTNEYIVEAQDGKIRSKHVVHATNAYASALVPGMLKKIVPCRATMTAQRPGIRIGLLQCAYVFFNGNNGYDYLTQLPTTGAMMLGGAWGGNMDEIARSDDNSYDVRASRSLSGALPILLGDENWGAEGQLIDEDDGTHNNLAEGRVISTWTGIIGASADGKLQSSSSLLEVQVLIIV